MGTILWAEVRRRWRGAVVTGIVFGLGFGLTFAAAAGARRTDSAFPRMLAATNAPDLLVSQATAPADFYDKVAALGGVEQTGRMVALGLVPEHVPKGTGLDITGAAQLSADGHFGYDIDGFNLIDGRMPGRAHADEILITKSYADAFGLRVGDDLDLVLALGPPPAAGEATAADGPVRHVTVAGIGVPATQVVPVSDLDAAPAIFGPPALLRSFAPAPEAIAYDGMAVTLAPGTDLDRLSAQITDAANGGQAFVQDDGPSFASVRDAIHPQVDALWLFALAVGAMTTLVGTQLLVRQLAAASAGASDVWRAVGVTRTGMTMLTGVPTVVTAAVAALVAGTGAVLLSGWFPIGPARLAEVERGLEVRWAVLGLATLALVVLTLGIAAIVSYVVTRPSGQAASVGWFSGLRARSSRPSLLLGLNLSSEGGRGVRAVPLRSAVAGVALAVAAAVATATFATGLSALVTTPARYGRDWDLMVDGMFSSAPTGALVDALDHDPAVAAIALGRYAEVKINGSQVPTIGLTDEIGTTFPEIIDGRSPQRADEIVLGRKTLDDLGVSIGDTVAFDSSAMVPPQAAGAPSEGETNREMRVVGTAAFPRLNHGSFSTLGLGTGAVVSATVLPPYDAASDGPLSPEDAAAVTAPDGNRYEFVTVRAAAGASAADRRHVLDVVTGVSRGMPVRTQQRPTAIDSYADVRLTPVILALVLGAMAAATLAHLVFTVVRRRRRDLALSMALGLDRGQVVRAVVLHALLVGGAALVAGVPLGIVGGKLAWSAFASDLGVRAALAAPFRMLLLVVLAVEALAAVVAIVPGFMAARTEPAVALRAE